MVRTSIIMPVYNTSKYVVDSIRSVVDQTSRDWELIVLVDASPDESLLCINKYLAAHPDDRVRVFENHINQGVSNTRNRGLDEARGEWIAFLDSDDKYHPHFLSAMHSVLNENEADLAVCGHTLVRDDGSHRMRFPVTEGTYSGKDAALLHLQDRLSPYVWDKVIKRSVIEKHRFVDGLRRGEDTVMSMSLYLSSERVVVVPSCLYLYTVVPNSASWMSGTSAEETRFLVRSLQVAAGDIVKTPEGKQGLLVFSALSFLLTAQQALVLSGPSSQNRIVQECSEALSWKNVAELVRSRPQFGAAVALLKSSPRVYKLLYGLYIKRVYGALHR